MRNTWTTRAAAPLAVAAWLTLAGPAAAAIGDPDCPEPVWEALQAAGESGAERELIIFRHPETGIQPPTPLVDLSCIGDILRIPRIGDLRAPTDILEKLAKALERRICAEAQQAWRDYVARPLRRGVYAHLNLDVLPGLGLKIGTDIDRDLEISPGIEFDPDEPVDHVFDELLGN